MAPIADEHLKAIIQRHRQRLHVDPRARAQLDQLQPAVIVKMAEELLELRETRAFVEGHTNHCVKCGDCDELGKILKESPQ